MTPLPFFLILATANQYYYDDHAFSLESNDSSFVLINDSGFFPAVQDNYVVQNIGRVTIEAELWYGDEVQWFGVVCGATIHPGEIKTLDNGGKLYYYTGLKVINSVNDRALFHGRGGYLQSPYIPGVHYDMFRRLRNSLPFAVKYIPVNCSECNHAFKELVLAFWPDEHPSIWAEILETISPLLGKNLSSTIGERIQQDLDPYRNLFNNLTYTNTSRESYMAMAFKLVELENPFRYISGILNSTYALPLFSNIVSMKLHYYILGLRGHDKLGLSADDIQNVKSFATQSFNEASKYISHISSIVFDRVYYILEAPCIFNDLMTIRSHFAVHGHEYIPIWKQKLLTLKSDEVYNPVISYSSFFGRPTGNLYAQSTPEQIPPPLNPNMEISKRTQLTKITLYMWCKNAWDIKIGGAKIFFQNGEEYSMGTKTAIVETVNLDGAHILQVTAFGEGKIDGLIFHLTNGQIFSYGQVNSSTYTQFQLPHHYISSIYLSSDDPDLEGQAGNIAVSFQWLVK